MNPFDRFSPTERKIVKVTAVVLLFVALIVAIVLIIGAAKNKNQEIKDRHRETYGQVATCVV